MDQGIQQVVLTMTKEYSDQLAEHIGVESSVTEDDMKQYVNNVLKEISNNKK